MLTKSLRISAMESIAIKVESQDYLSLEKKFVSFELMYLTVSIKKRCLITYDRLFIIDFKLSISLKKLDVPSLKTTLRRQLTSAKS